MSLLNLFGSDASDITQSSRFAANLRKSTYDPLLITFNSIRTGKKKDTGLTKDSKPSASTQSTQSTQTIDILSQKMVLASSFDSLDSAQRQTQRESTCDYVVFVPTSFDINKDVMNAFYDSKFKQLFKRKTEFNNPAANIFLNWGMFESFVIFANKKINERQIAFIEKSYDSAKKEVGPLTNATKYAIDFSAATATNVPIELNELWELIYDELPERLKKTTLPLTRMLPYFYLYTNVFVLFNTSSVGRIPNYLPVLNSNMSMASKATPVDYTDSLGRKAAPSRNIEIMSAFLIGILTNKNLANRSELRSNKLKAIRDKTYLCTFKSTAEDSLNYDTLLKRLYYKFPCFLTPSLMVPREKIIQMCDEVVDESADFESALAFAVSKLDGEMNACNIICAVAVATYGYIMLNVDLTASTADIETALDDIYKELNDGDTFSDDIGKINAGCLTPLLEPARAIANSIWAAAKYQTSIPKSEEKFMRKNLINAMERVIFEQCNFAAFMYNNTTLLSLMKYSDQSPVHKDAPKHADYLKTFYKSLANGVDASAQLTEQDEFNRFNDEMLYIIHGPLFFDYEWIFHQDPSLIRHILGEELLPAQDSTTATSTKEQSQWIPRVDPLTENVHYVNRNPPPNYPKMRFDNPTPLPDKNDSRRDYTDPRYTKKTWREMYISPEQARAEKTLDTIKEASTNAKKMTNAINRISGIGKALKDWNDCTDGAATAIDKFTKDEVDAIYNWTTPGYYRYELTSTQNLASTNEQLTYRFMQLMRPVEPGAIQDYTEPNLPTAYPAPLMFITPPMRGPTNSFMLHTWIPDLSSKISPSYSKFMTGEESNGKKSLNRGAYMEQLYKMMQLVFKTVILNARSAGSTSATASATASSSSSKRICVKIMAIGYGSDERNLKMVSDEDKKFIGDSFFYAVRDYSMFYESNNVSVIVYYDEKTQQDVKQRYNEYTSQRESVLLRMGSSTSQATTIDETLKLQIMPVEDFFTLKFQMGGLNLQEKDLLYFVNYCSTPRAFIGNCGECPDNVEDVVNEEIGSLSSSSPSSQLGECLRSAQGEIETLYDARKIVSKMTGFENNLQQWNERSLPKRMVSFQEKIRDTYVNYNANREVVEASETNQNPTNVNVSWWMMGNANAIPRNAYLSSFDEHVLILHNMLSQFKATVDDFNASVHVYTQAKKILTLLSKIKPDNIQINTDDIEGVKKALAYLTVNMSWSMDAKFTTGVCDGAFIPNSSVLHNPFICAQLLDINKWQYVDFDDIASREIPETKPLPPLLKKIVDLKIQESLGVSSVSAESSAVNSGILIVSKQPSIARLMKNVKTIFENLFQKNAPMKIDGKEMVLNNYAWPEEQLYCKIRNDTKLASFKRDGGRQAIDFAELRGLRSSSASSARKCIEFPLFVVQLTLTLFEGKLSDITLLDQAGLTCSSDKAMMDSNLKIVWEQMMTNLKAKEQNFTIANVFKRLGFNSANAVYDYTSYFDADPHAIGLLDATQNNGTATILICCTDVATNPILRTTNSKKLKAINEEVSDNALEENKKFYDTPPFEPTDPLHQIGFPYNSIRALAQIAEYFNLVEMHGVAGIEIEDANLTVMKTKLANLSDDYTPRVMTNPGAHIGWNAAIQTDSTMLYVNPNVMVNGTLQDISTYVLTLKPGDKMLIKTDTDKAKYRKECIDATVRMLKRWGERKGLQLAKFLLYCVYLMSFVLGFVGIGSVKALIELGKGLLNSVKQGTMVSVVGAGTGATGILALAAWLPATFIVAIVSGIIEGVKKLKKRRTNAGVAGVAAPVASGDDDDDDAPGASGADASGASGDDDDDASVASEVAASVVAGDDDDDLSDLEEELEADLESIGDISAPTVEEPAALEEGLTILQKYLAKSETFKNDFIGYVKSAYEKSIEKPFETDFRGLPRDVRMASDSVAGPIDEKADEINTGLNAQKADYDAQTATDKALAIEAFERCFEKTQMWMITESPTRNSYKNLSDNVINIPVYHFRLRTSNLINPGGEEIRNDTPLKVEFQKFSKDE